LGTGLPAYTQGLRQGCSGIELLPFTHPGMASTVGAPVRGFSPDEVMEEADLRRLPLHIPMALQAAREAMHQAGLDSTCPEVLADDIGLMLGTGGGGIDFTLDQVFKMQANGRPSLWTVTNATHGNMAGELSIRLGLRGPSQCISNGCASSSDAIGLAADLLRTDRPGAPRAMVVVGADAHIRWETLMGMELLGVISTRNFRDSPAEAATACRPFDQTRDGFVLGEGAWALVLEREDAAHQRGVRTPVGELLGYGSTCDAYHRVRPDPSMTQTVRAMQLALRDAGITPDQLSAVQYHGTATALNDAHETLAVMQALGPSAHTLPGSSIKGAIGHPQGACGAASMVAMLAALGDAHPFVPPTINLHQQDEDCPLDYTPLHARPLTTDQARRPFLVNCLAFGAKNSVLVAQAFTRD
jgi:3-oxoacyl-[acyl-carrier-protein] synthase II